MTNMRDVVVDVEQAFTVCGVNPNAFATHQVQRLVVRQFGVRPERVVTPVNQVAREYAAPGLR